VDVRNVEKPSHSPASFKNMKGHTGEKPKKWTQRMLKNFTVFSHFQAHKNKWRETI
jgi:hypothetical protein